MIILLLLIIISGLFVLLTLNPIHSLLCLIFTYICVVIFFIGLKAEFLAWSILIVYVGAISVLFLFIIMMINISQIEQNEYMLKFNIKNFFSWLIFSVVLYLTYDWVKDFNLEDININGFTLNKEKFLLVEFGPNPELKICIINWIEFYKIKTNILVVGSTLYSYYDYYFILSGLILLLALLGGLILIL